MTREGARNRIVAEGTELGANLRKASGDYMAFNSKNAEISSQQALDSAARGKTLSISAILIAVIAMSAFGYFLVANITRSLSQIQQMVNRVESNLTPTVRERPQTGRDRSNDPGTQPVAGQTAGQPENHFGKHKIRFIGCKPDVDHPDRKSPPRHTSKASRLPTWQPPWRK